MSDIWIPEPNILGAIAPYMTVTPALLEARAICVKTEAVGDQSNVAFETYSAGGVYHPIRSGEAAVVCVTCGQAGEVEQVKAIWTDYGRFAVDPTGKQNIVVADASGAWTEKAWEGKQASSLCRKQGRPAYLSRWKNPEGRYELHSVAFRDEDGPGGEIRQYWFERGHPGDDVFAHYKRITYPGGTMSDIRYTAVNEVGLRAFLEERGWSTDFLNECVVQAPSRAVEVLPKAAALGSLSGNQSAPPLPTVS